MKIIGNGYSTMISVGLQLLAVVLAQFFGIQLSFEGQEGTVMELEALWAAIVPIYQMIHRAHTTSPLFNKP